MEEVDQIDRTVIPTSLADLSPWITGYRFSYWRTEHEDRYLELVCRGHIGEDSWALLDLGHCYNKVRRRWEYEVLPSSRDSRFMRECRMTLAEARPILARQLYYRHWHARRKVARMIWVSRWREERSARKAAMQTVATVLNQLVAAMEERHRKEH